MINNTPYQGPLKSKKKRRILFISSGLIVFSLVGQMIINSNKNTSSSDSYKDSYIENIQEIEESGEEFDEDFVEIYNSENIKIGDKTYQLKNLLILRNDDGNVHLKTMGGENIDILTNEPFTDNSVRISFFRDSSIFYNLYQDGLLDKNGIKDPSSVISVINTWGGGKHDKTKETLAEKRIYDELNKSIGR